MTFAVWQGTGSRTAGETDAVLKFILCECFQGGYNLTSLAQSVCQTVHTLLGDPAPRLANLDDPCKRSVSLSVIFSRQILACLCVFTLEMLFLF